MAFRCSVFFIAREKHTERMRGSNCKSTYNRNGVYFDSFFVRCFNRLRKNELSQYVNTHTHIHTYNNNNNSSTNDDDDDNDEVQKPVETRPTITNVASKKLSSYR